MCPDTNEHKASECAKHGCENFIRELEELAPWGTSRRGLREWAR